MESNRGQHELRPPIHQGTVSKQQFPNTPQRGPAYKKDLKKHKAAPGLAASPQKPPLFSVCFSFFLFSMRSKGTTKAQGLLLIKRKQSNGCWGGWGADQALQPYATNWGRALGTHGFGAVCSGLRWSSRVGFCCRASPPMGPHSLPPRKAGKSHQESPQKIQDPLTSNARDGRGTSAFLRCSPPPPPPLPHRRPPAPLQKH